jgi:hypothetical protein
MLYILLYILLYIYIHTIIYIRFAPQACTGFPQASQFFFFLLFPPFLFLTHTYNYISTLGTTGVHRIPAGITQKFIDVGELGQRDSLVLHVRECLRSRHSRGNRCPPLHLLVYAALGY